MVWFIASMIGILLGYAFPHHLSLVLGGVAIWALAVLTYEKPVSR